MVILLCLELMLNAGNLALVAFSRMVGNQQGQVFAIVVMVIAACEVVVGLGLIVAIFRRKLPLERRRPAGAARMSATSLGLAGPAPPAARLDRHRARLPGDLPAQVAGDRSAPPRSASPSSAGSAPCSACSAKTPEARHHASSLWDYASVAGLDIKLGIYVDPLSVFMVLVVTGVSTLIHLYSFGYMQSDEGYHRFFSYLNFFVFSMLLLVLAGNFVLLIVGWAFVGFASYALISFWYRRTTATRAGMKAFVINVVGDIGLDPRRLPDLPRTRDLRLRPKSSPRRREVFHTNEWTVTAICLLLLVGAFAKSAQLPFHTWLPDAMEGPTPVSSLIHAATMVTAGVYLIARTHVLFVLAPTAADIAAFVGLATLLVAGTIALVMTDLKRAIAYSTMSQIGYMIVGVSIGAYSAGMFHLMTHAFFKALLFMARRLDHRGDGEQAEHRRDERLRQGDAVHLDHDALRRPRPRRLPRHLGLLLQGRDPRLRHTPAAACT